MQEKGIYPLVFCRGAALRKDAAGWRQSTGNIVCTVGTSDYDGVIKACSFALMQGERGWKMEYMKCEKCAENERKILNEKSKIKF